MSQASAIDTEDNTRVAWITFAAVMLSMTGTFNIVFGLVALIDDTHYRIGPQGLLVLDLTGWGWTMLVFGALAVVTGFALFTNAVWARVSALLLAGLNAIAHMMFLSAYPVWSLLAIALDVLVFWAIMVHGDVEADEQGWAT